MALVELTVFIGFANLATRVNTAHGITSQGYSNACEIPLARHPDVAEDVELAESLSIAMLTVLETLAPTQRAVFVLREVFELPYGEIAEAVGKSAAAVRQITRRAREHVAARRPRMQVSRSEQQAVLERLAGKPAADHQGTGPWSRKNPPVGPSSPRVANLTAISAPSAAVRKPV